MEEGVKRKAKGKRKKGKKRKEVKEEAEVTELQERLSISSPESEHERMRIKETSFPVGGSVEEVQETGAVSKQPLKRSDSELTSIVVVNDKEEKTRVPLAKEETAADSDPLISEVADVSEEIATSPRRRATLSRLDSGVINEEDEENIKDVSIPIDEAVEEEMVDSSSFKNMANVDKIEEEALKSEENPVSEDSQGNIASLSEKDEDEVDDELPIRNPVPDGSSETMESESAFVKPPSPSQRRIEISLEKSTKEDSRENVMDLDDVSGTLPWEMYRYIQKEEREEEESDFEEYDGQTVGDNLAKSDDLPSIDKFDDSLEDEDSGLGTEKPPPLLYDNAQQKEMHKYVDELKQSVADEEIAAYLEEFEKKIEEEIIEVGDISVEDVQEEERRLREEHIAYRQREARIERDREKEIMLAMENAKKHVMTLFRQKCRLVLMRQEHLMQRDRLLQDRIHRSFRRSENHLLKALTKRMGEVKTMYGDLVFTDGEYDGSKCRRWKVDWIRTPQPIQIKLKCFRGIKNKLPASRYVLMATLYSRLGGHVMKWSNLKGQQWGGSTLPINHEGEFFNIELKIDQSVFAVCPSRPDMKAGMILLFELLILRGSVTPTDKVVGWGCFPICDGNFNIADGRHKIPMLRGSMDSSISKFTTIEKLITSDIDHWLCNLYFEIVKLPKYLAGQKEYEVELQFTNQTSQLLKSGEIQTGNPPIFVKDSSSIAASYKQGSEKPMPPSVMASTVSMQSVRPPPYSEAAYDNEGYVDDAVPGPSNLENQTLEVPAARQRKTADRSVSPSLASEKLRKLSQVSGDVRQRKPSKVTAQPPDITVEGKRPFTVYGSRKVVEEQGVYLGEEDSSSESEYSGDEVCVVGKGNDLKPVEGQYGIFYKVRQSHLGENESKKFYTMLPKTPLLVQQRKRRKLTHLEELEQHTFSIKTKWQGKDSMLRESQRKMRYVRRMLPVEFDLWQYKSKEFWSMMLMLVLVFWLRLYMHYIGQWVLLQARSIPVTSIEYLPYTVKIFYRNSILITEEAIAMVVVGPYSNLLILVTLIIFSYYFQLLFDRFPNLCSRFIMAYGIQTILDPFWILLVDTASLRFKNTAPNDPIGDAYLLFFHFSRFYGNGVVTLFIAISITLFLYAASVICGCIIVYLYFMRLHNNGRMMDIYWRLHEPEAKFFMPYDLELSNEELGYICRKAEKWRGQEGEQRKVGVYHYTWEEEDVADEEWDMKKSKKRRPPRQETITHVSIHTVHLDGLRQLHRHFLKLSNGAIVEVFGEVDMQDGNENVEGARLMKHMNQEGAPRLRRLSRPGSGSSASSAKPKERRTSQFLDLPPMMN